MRDSVLFYRSFYEAVKNLPAEEFKKSVQAILEYGLDGEEPKTEGIEKTVFLLTKPQIDANNRRYENGKRGGKPKCNQGVTESKPNDNQNLTSPEPKEKVKVKDKVKDKEKDNIKRFAPPTVEDVNAYCWEKGYSVDAERFVDFYESKGWMVGKNRMKDWKAAVRNWSRSQRQELTAEAGKRQGKAAAPNRFHNFQERDYDFSALQKALVNK